MKLCKILFTFFALVMIVHLSADLQEWEKMIPGKQTLVSVSPFVGDQYGDFKGDFVAHLSDGSSWKVHPYDSLAFSLWTTTDILHVGFRTSFYFFKREHKFEIVNHTRNETVRVMIVDYPKPAPLQIVFAEEVLENSVLVPYVYSDKKGQTYTTYYPQNTYVKKLTLSDGSIYTIAEDFDYYSIGDKVYVVLNASKSCFDLALADGLDRYSYWTRTRKIN